MNFFFTFFLSIFQISLVVLLHNKLNPNNKIKIIDKKIFYLTILKFSLGIIFSISFLGAGKSILFSKKTIPKK